MKQPSYFKRHVKEGMNNFTRNGWVTVAAVSSLAFMLLMIGVTLLILLNLNHMTTKVEENVEIRVYLANSYPEEQRMISNKIKALDHVASVDFISKSEGLQSFMKTLGDEGAAFQTLEEDNPLNDVLVIKTEQPQDVAAIAKKVENLALVDKVDYGENVVNLLFSSTKLARMIGAIFIICLTLISVHLVTNTIKMTIVARKEEIQLRKLIGATNHFIRSPFFIEGSLIGVLGASVASLFIITGYYFVSTYIQARITIPFIDLISPFPFVLIFSGTLLILGVLIGMWGAVSSLRRILKV